MKRRDILKMAPAVLAASAAPATALVAAGRNETPVMRLFREWRAAQALVLEAEDDDTMNERSDLRTEIELRLFAEPALNERDIVLKMLALTLDGEDWTNDAYNHGGKIAVEARALIA
ncbi:hypothetical protein [Paracoccus yeei]|uniref:hypothetical protein n=1 Tax=Paracoccus yeei TaxID=147645 RepID=UPI001748D884|nr:hypothetical protein [Paracoccus yeei]